MARIERRSSVRVPARLAMEIKIGGADATEVSSLNVSANGVYFASSTYIPVLTKLDITLDLPTEGGGDKRGDSVSCRGVVVRTQPEEEQPGLSEYEIACFFTSIDEADRETLESYILKQVSF